MCWVYVDVETEPFPSTKKDIGDKLSVNSGRSTTMSLSHLSGLISSCFPKCFCTFCLLHLSYILVHQDLLNLTTLMY